jgi:hypothetical protein
VIDRFSDDIDLSMSPAFVDADEAAFKAITSRTRRAHRMSPGRSLVGERDEFGLHLAPQDSRNSSRGRGHRP